MAPDDLPPDLLDGIRILLVDDDRDGLAALEIVLVDRGARVQIATDVDAGLRRVADFAPDLLLERRRHAAEAGTATR